MNKTKEEYYRSKIKKLEEENELLKMLLKSQKKNKSICDEQSIFELGRSQ